MTPIAKAAEPWSKATDVPAPICFIRNDRSEGLSWSQIMSAGTDGLMACNQEGATFIPYKDLWAYQHSTTRRADDWHPCTVATPAQDPEAGRTDVAAGPKTGPVPLEDLRRLCGGREPHRTDWTWDMLPDGTRPLWDGEKRHAEDEWFPRPNWEAIRLGNELEITTQFEQPHHRTHRSTSTPFRGTSIGGNAAQDAVQTARERQRERDAEDRAWAEGRARLFFANSPDCYTIESLMMEAIDYARERAQARAVPDETEIRQMFEEKVAPLGYDLFRCTDGTYRANPTSDRWVGFRDGFHASRRSES